MVPKQPEYGMAYAVRIELVRTIPSPASSERNIENLQ
jgi:hypothetical protein